MGIRKIVDRIPCESHSLPIFAVENITVHNARIDRFEVKFDKLKLCYQREPQFDSIMLGLRRNNLFFQAGGRNQSHFSIRDDNLISCEPFKFNPWRSGRVGNYSRSFDIKFNCNLNRFIAHQHLFLNKQRTERNTRLSQVTAEEAFICNPDTEEYLKSKSLDKNDNYLVHGFWEEGQDFTYWLEHYFNQLHDLLLENLGVEIEAPSSLSADEMQELLQQHRTTAVLDFAHWFIPYLEIAWDFKHDDAIGFVKRIEPAFRRASRVFLRNEYIVAGGDEALLPENQDSTSIERVNNTYGLTARISKHLSLRLYAKTCHRVRMEVVLHHPRKGLNEFVRRYTKGTKERPFAANAPMHGLPYNIAAFTHFAAEHIAVPFFEGIEIASPNTFSLPQYIAPEHLKRFLQVLYKSTDGKPEVGARFLEMLSLHGSIVRTGDAAIDYLTDCLVKARIMRRISTAKRERTEVHLFCFTQDYLSLQHLSYEDFLRVFYSLMKK